MHDKEYTKARDPICLPPREENRDLIKFFKDLDYQHELDLSCLCDYKDNTPDLGEYRELEYSRESDHERSDNQFRLTEYSKYSTAHYKYLQIISKELDHNEYVCKFEYSRRGWRYISYVL